MERWRETEEKMTKANEHVARERLTAEHPLFPSAKAKAPSEAIVRGYVDSFFFASLGIEAYSVKG